MTTLTEAAVLAVGVFIAMAIFIGVIIVAGGGIAPPRKRKP